MGKDSGSMAVLDEKMRVADYSVMPALHGGHRCRLMGLERSKCADLVKETWGMVGNVYSWM